MKTLRVVAFSVATFLVVMVLYALFILPIPSAPEATGGNTIAGSTDVAPSPPLLEGLTPWNGYNSSVGLGGNYGDRATAKPEGSFEYRRARGRGLLGHDEEVEFPVEDPHIIGEAGGGGQGGYGGIEFRRAPAPSQQQPEPPLTPAPPTADGIDDYGRHRDGGFQRHETNPFVDTDDDALSTFGLDVDTASYTMCRRVMLDGERPQRDAVRVEEFVNFFDMGYEPPSDNDFAVHLECAPSPFGGEGYYLCRVGIQGRVIPEPERQDVNLTFVVDRSGSMNGQRLAMVKEAMFLLLEQLRPQDRVRVVSYNADATVDYNPLPGEWSRRYLYRTLESLYAQGTTNLDAGLRLGYQVAMQHLDHDRVNRVILLTDGIANTGETMARRVLENTRLHRERGIALTCIGVGMDTNDALLQELADAGDGSHHYVDCVAEAERVFVENLTGTLHLIARNARVQVAFAPEVVSRYRLLGYENRAIADERFRDDTVDAGEIGSGHTVTALYEIKLHNDVALDDDALVVQLRWLQFDTGDDPRELAVSIRPADFQHDWADASPRFILAACVAEFAELLRGTYWSQDSSIAAVQETLRTALPRLGEAQDVGEFMLLLDRAAAFGTNQ